MPKKLPVRKIQMLLLQNEQGQVLQRRPPTGMWGGLWGFPELPVEENSQHWCLMNTGSECGQVKELPVRRHRFSHFHLEIHAKQILLEKPGLRVLDGDRQAWYNPAQPDERGLATPVKLLLDETISHTEVIK